MWLERCGLWSKRQLNTSTSGNSSASGYRATAITGHQFWRQFSLTSEDVKKKFFQESRHAAQMPPQIWESPFWLSTNHIIHRFSSWPSSQARSMAHYPDDHKLQGNLRVLLCRDGLIREEREYHVWLDGKGGNGGWGYLFTSGQSIIANNSSVQSWQLWFGKQSVFPNTSSFGKWTGCFFLGFRPLTVITACLAFLPTIC